MSTEQRHDTRGLWHDNPALVQLLGLSPLLAMSDATVTALALGLCTLLVLMCSNLCTSLLRNRLSPALRLPVFALLIASFTTVLELTMSAYAYPLSQRLGIFLPLIAANSLLFARAERCASKASPSIAVKDAVLMGLGFLFVFIALGMTRELLGTGQLFADLEQLLPFAANWKLSVFGDAPLPLALLPPGALLLLGGFAAFKNVLDQRRARTLPEPELPPPGSKRVRVTGQL